MKPIEYWKNSKGEYNYHIVGSNGRILAEIKQGFTRKANMIKNIRAVYDALFYITGIHTDDWTHDAMKQIPAPKNRSTAKQIVKALAAGR